MCLYKMEFYKLIHKKIVFIGMISVIGIILLFFWFVEIGEEFASVDGKTYIGYEAVRMNRKITEEFAGRITNDKIDQIVDKYGVPSKIVEGLPEWGDGNYLNAFVARYFTNGSFERGIVPTERYPLEKSELGQVCSQYKKVPTLAYTKGWKVFGEVFHFALILGSILIICGVSGVFADEGTTKMMPLIFTTKEGRRKELIAKIAAAFTLTILILIGIIVLDLLLCNVVYGLEGFYNITGIVLSNHPDWLLYQQKFSDYFGITLMLGVQGLLSLCSITLCVSAWYNRSFSAVVVASVVWVIPVLMRILFSGLISLFIYATPIFLVMNGILEEVYSFWYIVVIISLLLGTGCLLSGYRKYKTKSAS